MKINFFQRLIQNEKGATATEYAIMITLVLLVVFASVVFLGQHVETVFNDFGSSIAPYVSGS